MRQYISVEQTPNLYRQIQRHYSGVIKMLMQNPGFFRTMSPTLRDDATLIQIIHGSHPNLWSRIVECMRSHLSLEQTPNLVRQIIRDDHRMFPMYVPMYSGRHAMCEEAPSLNPFTIHAARKFGVNIGNMFSQLVRVHNPTLEHLIASSLLLSNKIFESHPEEAETVFSKVVRLPDFWTCEVSDNSLGVHMARNFIVNRLVPNIHTETLALKLTRLSPDIIVHVPYRYHTEQIVMPALKECPDLREKLRELASRKTFELSIMRDENVVRTITRTAPDAILSVPNYFHKGSIVLPLLKDRPDLYEKLGPHASKDEDLLRWGVVRGKDMRAVFRGWQADYFFEFVYRGTLLKFLKEMFYDMLLQKIPSELVMLVFSYLAMEDGPCMLKRRVPVMVLLDGKWTAGKVKRRMGDFKYMVSFHSSMKPTQYSEYDMWVSENYARRKKYVVL